MILLFATILEGCSAGPDLAYGLTKAEILGSWSGSDPGSRVGIQIDPDGRYVMQGWPRNVGCGREPEASTLQDVSWGDTVTFESYWNQYSDSVSYMVYFSGSSKSPRCTGWSAAIFRDKNGTLEMQFYLDSVIDPDNVEPNQIISLKH